MLTSQAKARAELCGLQNCSEESPAATTPPATAGAEGAAGIAHASGTSSQSSAADVLQPRLAQESSTELAKQPAGAPAQPLAVAAAGGSSTVLAAAAGRHAALPGGSRHVSPAHTAPGEASASAVQSGTATGPYVAAAAGLQSRRMMQQVAPPTSGRVSGQSAQQQCGPRGARPASWRWNPKRLSRSMSASSGVRVRPPGSRGRVMPTTAQRSTDRKPRARHENPCATRGNPCGQRVRQSGARAGELEGLRAGAVGSTDAVGAGPRAWTAVEAGSAAAGAGQADGSGAEARPAGAAVAEVGWARGAAEAGHANRTLVPGASCAAGSKVVPKASSTGSLPAGQAGIGGISSAVGVCSAVVNQAADKTDFVGPVHARTECHQLIPGLISGCDSSELMCGDSLTGSQSSLGAARGQPAAPGSSKHMAAAVDAADAAPQMQAGAAELRPVAGACPPEPAAVHAQDGAPQQQAGPAELRCPGPAVAVQPAAVAMQVAAGVRKQASAAAHAADAAPRQAALAQLTELTRPSPEEAVQPAAAAVQMAAGVHKQASAAAHAADAVPQQQAGPAEPSGDKPADAAKPLDAEVKVNSKFGNRARAAAAWQALARSSKGLEMPAAASTHETGSAVPLQQDGSMYGELT